MRKITLNLSDILFYGRSYPIPRIYGSDTGNASAGTLVGTEKWFCTQTREILFLNDLLSQEVCTKENKDALLPRLGYIRLFEVDMIALEKLFIQSLNDRKITRFFGSIPDEDYDRQFNIFIEPAAELVHRWGKYEKDVLKKEAIAWCAQNHIAWSDL